DTQRDADTTSAPEFVDIFFRKGPESITGRRVHNTYPVLGDAHQLHDVGARAIGDRDHSSCPARARGDGPPKIGNTAPAKALGVFEKGKIVDRDNRRPTPGKRNHVDESMYYVE